MTVRLRAHHLLCMLTFIGRGYTPEFTGNYRRIAARLSAGEPIEVVEGPDDICAPLLSMDEAHCRNDSVTGRDEAAANAVAALIGEPVAPGMHIAPDAAFLVRLRSAFRSGVIRDGCAGCEWSTLCTDIAAADFSGVLVVAGGTGGA